MGAKLCILRNTGTAALPSDDDEYYNDERVDYSRSFLRKLKLRCLNYLKTEKHKKMICQQHQESMEKEDSTTLEQLLIRSPSIEMMETTGSYSWRLSPKVCPLTISCCDESESEIGSSSIHGATVTGDEPRRERVVSSSRRRSSSGNTRRVRFKSPEEADIHLIHSHYDSEECEV